MLVRYAEGNLDTCAVKDEFMISTNDMNDFMMRAILGDGNIQSGN